MVFLERAEGLLLVVEYGAVRGHFGRVIFCLDSIDDDDVPLGVDGGCNDDDDIDCNCMSKELVVPRGGGGGIDDGG